jgi:putative hydrolase of the HAD superfamily
MGRMTIMVDKQLRAVVFDLDGTLYPYYRMYLHSIPFFLKYSYFVYNYSKVRSEIRRIPQISDFKRVQAELLATRLGLPIEETYVLIEKIIYGEWESVFKSISPFPALIYILKKLKKLDLKLAVLSDYPVKNKLAYLGIENLWDYALSSEDVGYLKPDSRPFYAVAEGLNIPPGQILYVGDIYEYDIVGARNAGMKTAYFTPFSNPKKGQVNKSADIRFTNYSSFYQLLVKRFCLTNAYAI